MGDPDKHSTLVFLTNHLDFGATTIAAIYKDRWQVELFFKALKQNLKIKTFPTPASRKPPPDNVTSTGRIARPLQLFREVFAVKIAIWGVTAPLPQVGHWTFTAARSAPASTTSKLFLHLSHMYSYLGIAPSDRLQRPERTARRESRSRASLEAIVPGWLVSLSWPEVTSRTP